MSREAMEIALEALEEINKLSIGENAICLPAEIDGAMDALRQALETKREWVGLTLNEAEDFYDKYTDRAELINAVDKFLEEKNRG